MSTKIETELIDSTGGSWSEPGGRAQRPAGAARLLEDRLPDEVRDRLADEVIDELLAGACTEEEIVGPGGVLAQLTKRLVERAMSAELTEHLGYEPHQEPPGGTGNNRNGSTAKTLASEHGPVRIETPRDRKGSFEPQIIRKGQRRFERFDDKILALYSRGLSTRDIEAHLAEIYGVRVGRDLISRVTDAVMDDVRAWQQRPLDDVYPVIFLDALVLTIREGGTVLRRALSLALGVAMGWDAVQPGGRQNGHWDFRAGRSRRPDGHEEGLRRTRGWPQGYSWAPTLSIDSVVNVGTVPTHPALTGGQARRLLAASVRGGAVVLVRAGESSAHGEGRQQARGGRTGRL